MVGMRDGDAEPGQTSAPNDAITTASGEPTSSHAPMKSSSTRLPAVSSAKVAKISRSGLGASGPDAGRGRRPATSTITITFGDVAENHVGMQKIGVETTEGFTIEDLKAAQRSFEARGLVCEYRALNPALAGVDGADEAEEASVLIIRNGVSALLTAPGCGLPAVGAAVAGGAGCEGGAGGASAGAGAAAAADASAPTARAVTLEADADEDEDEDDISLFAMAEMASKRAAGGGSGGAGGGGGGDGDGDGGAVDPSGLGDASADDLFEEQNALPVDTKAWMHGRVVNKVARYNLCFGEEAQEPCYEEKRGRIVAFDAVPLTRRLRSALPAFFGPKARLLQAEGNYYYDSAACGIGFHGDGERKLVIAVRLGASMPLHYQWFRRCVPVGARTRLTVHHGDVYIMSAKAAGNDWRRPSILTLRHAAGCAKFTTIKGHPEK